MRAALLLWYVGLVPAQNVEGVLEGTVKDALTGAAVPGARLTILGCGRLLGGVSGANGDFRVADVPPCLYEVSARRLGYAGADYGARPLRVKVGAGSAFVEVPLTPTGDLEGRVLDEDHRPLRDVNVYAAGGARPRIQCVTDAEGRYLLPHLAAGSYRLEVRIPASVRRASLKRDASSGETAGFPVIVQWPAGVIATAGVRASGIEFVVGRVLLARVEGRLIDAATRGSAAGAQIALDAGKEIPLSEVGERRSPDARNGAFRFELVEPGSYVLRVYRGAGALSFAVPLHVPRQGVSGLTVTVPEFGAVSGAAVLPEGSRAAFEGMYAVLQAPDLSESVEASIDREGRFRFHDVPPGSWRVTVRGGSARPLEAVSFSTGVPREILYPARIRCGEADCADGRVTVAGGETEVVIELSNRVGRLSGRTAPDATVVVLSPGRRAFRAIAGPEGDFDFVALPPGSYELYVGDCGGRAVRVEVESGRRTVVQLRSCP